VCRENNSHGNKSIRAATRVHVRHVKAIFRECGNEVIQGEGLESFD
jgi:hypothetical protein